MNTLSSLLEWLGNTIGANPNTLTTTSKTLVGAINDVNKGVPIGAVEMFAGANAPSGWLKCDGSAVSRTTYASLFAIIGTTYGTGDGSSTFNLPNFNGRVPLGVGTSGTTGASSHALAAKGGAETHTHTTANHTLTINEMPKHSHEMPMYFGSGNFAAGGNGGWIQVMTYKDTLTTGGGAAHNHGNTGSTSQMNPFLTVNFIIFAGV